MCGKRMQTLAWAISLITQTVLYSVLKTHSASDVVLPSGAIQLLKTFENV